MAPSSFGQAPSGEEPDPHLSGTRPVLFTRAWTPELETESPANIVPGQPPANLLALKNPKCATIAFVRHFRKGRGSTWRRSKIDPEAEGAVLYIGPEAAAALVAIMSQGIAVMDPSTPVLGLSASQIGRRVNAAAKAAALGDGFTGHSGRGGMAQDLTAAGVELPALMTAGRWQSSKMPARYTERQAADRGAVARSYQETQG